MRANNCGRGSFAQSHEFSKHDFGAKNVPVPFDDSSISVQKNLICDLRSELNSLKNEFTMLMNHPSDESKPRRDNRAFLQSQFQPYNANSSFGRSSLSEKERLKLILENASSAQKWGNEQELTSESNIQGRSSSIARVGQIPRPAFPLANGATETVPENHFRRIGPHKPPTGVAKPAYLQRNFTQEDSVQKEKQPENMKLRVASHSFTPIQLIEPLVLTPTEFTVDFRVEELQDKVKNQSKEIEKLRASNQELISKITGLETLRDTLHKTQQALRQELQRERQRYTESKHEQGSIQEQILELKKKNSQQEQEISALREERDRIFQRMHTSLEEQKETMQIKQEELLAQQDAIHMKEMAELSAKLAEAQKLFSQTTQDPDREALQSKSSEQDKAQPGICECGCNTDPQEKQSWEAMVHEKEKQAKQTQEKVKLYLSNIDKQNVKIREMRAQLEASESYARQASYIIAEKESTIHTILGQLRTAEKEILSSRAACKQLEVLLEDSNQAVVTCRVQWLAGKYGEEK